MKKLSLTLFAFLTLQVGANNDSFISLEDLPIISSMKEDVAIRCLVRVDCTGDGTWDYTAVVDCEYAGAMAQQFVDSCN